ncbi:MAG TPA: hypothetical protein VJ249_03160 [Candidatus Bathyarchaeia archaeon]|nr:hypothetical protein [Candidatus Bathyarchaeia archaeon]
MRAFYEQVSIIWFTFTFIEKLERDYLAAKKLFIKHGRQVDAGTLLILNNLIEFMEQAADVCADTADYITILASQG